MIYTQTEFLANTGAKLASSSYDKTVRIWDVATGKLLLTLAQPAQSKGVAWSPDGKRVAAGTDYVDANGHVLVWNAVTGEMQLDIPVGYTRVGSVTFNPDGTRISAALLEAKSTDVWDAQSGQKLLAITDHTDWVTGVTYNNDGSRLATASLDGTAKVWDANTRQALLTLYIEHQREFNSALLSFLSQVLLSMG